MLLQNHYKKKNVKAHNYDQWIDFQNDLLVIESHTVHFVNNFEKF